jgi:hypothetical protein
MNFLGGNINTGSNFLDINGGGLGTFTSMKSGNTYYTIDTAGNPTVNALSTNQVTISQTAGSDFILFNNGDTRMNAKRNAYVQGDVSVYIDALQDSYLKARSNVILETTTGYINLVAQGGSNGIYCTGAFTELRGYLTFNAANNYINNLEHIYGDTSAPGGGLAIDYMYGLFFNSGSNDANLFASGGFLYLRNMAKGIGVEAYNPAGTGDSAFYVANNELYLATGAGHDIITNSGRNISMNAAQPGGGVGIYASTINTQSLLDTNINAGRYISFNAAQPGGSFGIYASTINSTTLLDTNLTIGQNFNVTATGSAQLRASYFNFFNDCYFNNQILRDMQGIVGPASTDLSIAANGARNLLFTGSNIQTTAFGTIDLTSYGNTNITTAFSNTILLNSDGNLTLQAARAGCNISLFSPDVFITGTSNVIINTKYSTWTGSNNFNILSSNIGITSSNAFDIVATGNGLILDGEFKRKLVGTNITQPIFQYEYVSTTGAASGTVTVTLPQRYTSVSSYIPFANVTNDATTTFYVSTVTRATFEIGWSGYTGFSDIVFSWNTLGT